VLLLVLLPALLRSQAHQSGLHSLAENEELAEAKNYNIFKFTSSVCDSSCSSTWLSLGGAAGASSSSSFSDGDSEIHQNVNVWYTFHNLLLTFGAFVVHGHGSCFHFVWHWCRLLVGFGLVVHVIAVESQQRDEVRPQRSVVVAQINALQEPVVFEIALK